MLKAFRSIERVRLLCRRNVRNRKVSQQMEPRFEHGTEIGVWPDWGDDPETFTLLFGLNLQLKGGKSFV